MAKENIRVKNEILRKIKVVKLKDAVLPDFVRRKKADLVALREAKMKEIKDILEAEAKRDRQKKLDSLEPNSPAGSQKSFNSGRSSKN